MKTILIVGLATITTVLGTSVSLAKENTAVGKEVHRTAGYVWRLDTEDGYTAPRNYREDKRLRMSGSGEPSKAGFSWLKDHLRSEGIAHNMVYIVDLREESHGYAGGKPISWYGENNWANVGKSTEAVLQDEETRLKHLKFPLEVYPLSKTKVAGKAVVVTEPEVATEAQLVEENGMNYKRFTCTDHTWPGEKRVQEYIAWRKSLPQKAWLHFHCQAGKGRTTTFMVIEQILQEGKAKSLEDITSYQHKLGGQDLLHLAQREDWRKITNASKEAGIRDFYARYGKK